MGNSRLQAGLLQPGQPPCPRKAPGAADTALTSATAGWDQDPNAVMLLELALPPAPASGALVWERHDPHSPWPDIRLQVATDWQEKHRKLKLGHNPCSALPSRGEVSKSFVPAPDPAPRASAFRVNPEPLARS